MSLATMLMSTLSSKMAGSVRQISRRLASSQTEEAEEDKIKSTGENTVVALIDNLKASFS